MTIYSQQVRALNLVHSLVNTGGLKPGCSVVVIGGGAAGITAAGSILQSGPGTRVTLIEKAEEVMPLQSGSAKRFVHPHIYDWPEKGSTEDDAGLPIFNWSAAEARVVAAELTVKWRDLRNGWADRLAFKRSAQLSSIRTVEDGYEVGWADLDGSHVQRADVLILAMGFGRDTDPLHQEDYWLDNWIDQAREGSTRWLVSGTGDGGLTDLMRLKVIGFQHHRIISEFSKGEHRSLEHVQQALAKAKPEDHLEVLSREFGASLQQILATQRIRQNTEVVLNDQKELSSARASLLNRLIVHELQQAGAFTFHCGQLGPPLLEKGKYRAEQMPGEPFDRILIRRGPTADVPLAQVAKLDADAAFKDSFRSLARKWADWTRIHRPQDDRTRIPCWTPEELNQEHGFKPPSSKISQPRLAGACLAIVGDTTTLGQAGESEFERTIRQAIAATKGCIAFDGVALSGKPHVVRASDAFTTAGNHNRVIDLLCEAAVAIFDVTEPEPAVMVLLGVRAAVRRGVTVTVTRNATAPDFWAKLPFNLREVNTISMAHPPGAKPTDRQSPIYRLSRALRDAATELQRQEYYSDLPGYFELRMPSSEGVIDEDNVLVLCPFDPDYLRESYQGFLGPELHSIFETKEIQLMSDLTSPKLLALRLYDAIRRAFFCVIDCTTWRPNVMFELGVRMAVSDQITVTRTRSPLH